MSQRVDELFAGGQLRTEPRQRLIATLLIVGVTLSVLGLCCTSVPGGLLTLGSWSVLETELARVHSGFLSATHEPMLLQLRRLVNGALLLTIILFLIQGALLCQGSYEIFWGKVLQLAPMLILHA